VLPPTLLLLLLLLLLGNAVITCVQVKMGYHSKKTKLDAGHSPTLARPAAPLADCVQRHPCIKTNKMWLPRQRPLMDPKNNFRLTIYSRSSTNPANLAKISPADCQMS